MNDTNSTGQPAASPGLAEATGSGCHRTAKVFDQLQRGACGLQCVEDQMRAIEAENIELRRVLAYIDRQVRECWPETIDAFSETHRRWCIKMAREILRPNGGLA